MPISNPTTGKLPRGSNTPTHNPSLPGRKRSSSNLSSKTRALRGSTGLTRTQEDRSRARLKQLAEERHGEDWAEVNDDDYNTMCRIVAAEMRKGGLRVTTKQVRDASKRQRNTPEIKTAYPVDLEPEEYAYIAYLHATQSRTMKAINSEMVRFYREHHA